MIYVDWLVRHGWRIRGRETASCHLFGDSPEELHAFALRLGLRRAWFHNASTPHYDLVPARREAAVRLGAAELTRETFRATVRRIRAAWRPGPDGATMETREDDR